MIAHNTKNQPWGQALWAQTAPKIEPHPPLNGDITCDIAIIGAGFTGLRAAHQCANAGCSTVVVDSQEVGFGASGRNGGQVNPLLPFKGPHELYKMLGATYFERLAQASLNSADQLFSYIKTHNIACKARQKGWLRVDHCEKTRKKAHELAKAWNHYGADIELIYGGDVHKMSGSTAYHSGTFLPKGGAVQPLALVRAMATLVQQAGGHIYAHTPVIKIEQQPKGWHLNTPKGRIFAQWVIIATNGYTDGLIHGLLHSIFPIVSIQMATRPLSDEQVGSILPQGQTIADTRRVIMYARREADNTIIFGSHGRLTAQGQLQGFKGLKKDAARIFPQITSSDWHHHWGGKLAITDNRLPHFHEPAKGLIIGLGYNGRGVAMSQFMGTQLAKRALGAAPEELAFPVSKIEKIPFKNIQLLGKGIVVKTMQWRDAWDMKGF